MHPLPRPAVVPQPSPPRLRRLPSPLASGLPAVVRALRPARAAVRALPVVRPVARRLQHGSLGGMAGERGSGRGRAWLVPVPLGPRRQRERGYNQSERLARALGRRWQRPVADLLVRVRDTAAQTALTPEARLANVAGAFEVRNRSPETPGSR